MSVPVELPEIESHPHAHAVLSRALSTDGHPSHAYLFHGPAGTGKRAIARAFAAALLSEEVPDPALVAQRVEHGTHPDLIWVAPSGASEMLVSDIEEPVVAAATRTPFEATRRVFVLESVNTMNDQAANRMLKTLEEPPDYVHLILIAQRPQDVLATIASRCQLVRFDPLPSERMKRILIDGGVDENRAEACANLALGDAELARWLAGEDGQRLRSEAERYVRTSLSGRSVERPWMGLLEMSKASGEQAGEELRALVESELELLPSREHRRHLREGADAQRRVERRMRTSTLDRGLRLAELWMRDLWCLACEARELVYAVDRVADLERNITMAPAERFAEGIDLIADTRLRLDLNVSEALALEALSYRLGALISVDY